MEELHSQKNEMHSLKKLRKLKFYCESHKDFQSVTKANENAKEQSLTKRSTTKPIEDVREFLCAGKTSSVTEVKKLNWQQINHMFSKP